MDFAITLLLFLLRLALKEHIVSKVNWGMIKFSDRFTRSLSYFVVGNKWFLKLAKLSLTESKIDILGRVPTYSNGTLFGQFSVTLRQLFLACRQQAASKLPRLAKNCRKNRTISVVGTRPRCAIAVVNSPRRTWLIYFLGARVKLTTSHSHSVSKSSIVYISFVTPE